MINTDALSRDDSGSAPRWNRTLKVEKRIIDHPKVEVTHEGLFFKGRRVITRHTPVLEGVYLGGGAREAIVVSDHDGDLKRLYDDVLQRCTREGRFNKGLVTKSVFDVVNENFPCKDPDRVDAFIASYNLPPDGKISLCAFIREGKGVCRHLALTCGALLEMLQNDGLISGRASVDRNTISHLGAHAWCRYTSSSGAVVILDAMHNYRGRLEDSISGAYWNYHRPDEY